MDSFANVGQGAQPVQAVAEGGASANPLRVVPTAQVNAGALGMTGNAEVARNVDSLLKISSNLLAPRIAEAKQEQFMQGVQEASSGKALTEIIEDRPWYTELFGPSAAAQGARAYTVQAQVAGFAADMENDMPKLAEQGPEAVRAAVNARMKAVLTGDSAADALISQAAVEQFAPLFKRHAKEHYVFMQNKASDAQLNSWSKAASVLQSQLSDPKTLPADREAAGARLLGQIGPFGDQTEASYERNIATFLQSAALDGNFQVLKLFRDIKVPGEGGKETTLWERIPLQTRSQIQAQLPAIAQKALDKLTPKYAMEMAMITLDTAQNPSEIPARIAAFNKKVAEAEGISDASMIPEKSVDQIVGRTLQAQAAAANAPDPNAAKAEKMRVAMAAVDVPGAMAQNVIHGLTDDVSAELAASERWNTTADPKARATILNNRGDGVYHALKSQLNTMGIGGNPEKHSKGIEHVAAVFAGMGEETRTGYFSTDAILFYDRFNSQVRANVPPEFAFATAKNTQPLARDMIPETERDEVQETVREVAESRNENMFGFNKVTDSALRIIEGSIAADYRKNRAETSVQVAVQRSYARAQANGLAVIGEHAVRGAAGMKPLEQILATGQGNIGPKEVATRFNKLVDTKIKAAGGTLDDYIIIRTPDVGGDAQYLLSAANEEGEAQFVTISGSELRRTPTTSKRTPQDTGILPITR